MKKPPFYANRSDGMSCMVSALRSVLEYFTGKTYSWKEVEDILGYQSGQAAWTVKAWTELASAGFDIRMIENFDYARYQAEGEAYLREFLRPNELRWQLENSNLLEIRPLIPEFLSTVHHEQRSPTLQDIDEMLADERLVLVQLDAAKLNALPKDYIAHMIVIYDKIGNDFVAHDPGFPAMAERRIAPHALYEAMGGADNTTEVTGIRLA